MIWGAWLVGIAFFRHHRLHEAWQIGLYSTADNRLTQMRPFIVGIFYESPQANYDFSRMSSRKTIKITSWPDPLMQERLEEIGFFFDGPLQAWIRFCEEEDLQQLTEWVRRLHLEA